MAYKVNGWLHRQTFSILVVPRPSQPALFDSNRLRHSQRAFLAGSEQQGVDFGTSTAWPALYSFSSRQSYHSVSHLTDGFLETDLRSIRIGNYWIFCLDGRRLRRLMHFSRKHRLLKASPAFMQAYLSAIESDKYPCWKALKTRPPAIEAFWKSCGSLWGVEAHDTEVTAALFQVQNSRQAPNWGKCFGSTAERPHNQETLIRSAQASLFTSSQATCLTRFFAVTGNFLCPQSRTHRIWSGWHLFFRSRRKLPLQLSQPPTLAQSSTITTSKQSAFLLRH